MDLTVVLPLPRSDSWDAAYMEQPCLGENHGETSLSMGRSCVPSAWLACGGWIAPSRTREVCVSHAFDGRIAASEQIVVDPVARFTRQAPWLSTGKHCHPLALVQGLDERSSSLLCGNNALGTPWGVISWVRTRGHVSLPSLPLVPFVFFGSQGNPPNLPTVGLEPLP